MIAVLKKNIKVFLSKWRRRNYPNVDASCHLGPNITVYGKSNLYMEHRANLSRDAIIMCTRAKFIMKRDSGAAAGLFVATGNHLQVVGMSKVDVTDAVKDKLDLDHKLDQNVIVNEEVWIGARSILLSGVNIGRGAIIGSGSVVRQDVLPYAIVEGNPAKMIGFRFTPEQIIEHEQKLYEEGERISYDVLKSNFNTFYGRQETIQIKTSRNIPINDYYAIFQKVFNAPISDVPSLEYKLTEGWDSVGHMSLVVELENELGISIKPEDFMKIDSVAHGLEVLKSYGINIGERENVVFPNHFFDFSQYQYKTAVIYEGKNYSYSDLDKVVYDCSEILKKGRLAILLADNTIGSLASYVACIKNGFPVALLDAHKDADFLQKIIDAYHPEYLILPSKRKQEFGGERMLDIYDYSVVHYEQTEYDINKNLCALLTTSGSTGSPKFVRLSLDNLKANAESIAQYLELDSMEHPITSLPMYYSYGLSVINSHLTVGATLLLTNDSVVMPSFWDYARRHKATSISGVPYTYDLFRKMKVMDMDLPTLSTFTQAGGKMAKDNVAFFAQKAIERGKRLIVMYGQTEATARISYLPTEKVMDKSGSIGISIPGGKMSIADDGELLYEGKNVSMGYAESFEDLRKGDERNGILYTGDIARQDEDGYFYITGRKKRFVKVYGNRVGLDELEQLLFPQFGKVICVGEDDHVLIASDNKDICAENVISYVSEKTKINQLAFSYRFLENIPYSDTGKIIYNMIKL